MREDRVEKNQVGNVDIDERGRRVRNGNVPPGGETRQATVRLRRKAEHAHDTRHVRILARRTDDTKAPSAERPEETTEPIVVQLRVERR